MFGFAFWKKWVVDSKTQKSSSCIYQLQNFELVTALKPKADTSRKPNC